MRVACITRLSFAVADVVDILAEQGIESGLVDTGSSAVRLVSLAFYFLDVLVRQYAAFLFLRGLHFLEDISLMEYGVCELVLEGLRVKHLTDHAFD